MTAPDTLTQAPDAPAVVRVPHTFWSMWHQTDYIARHLLAGNPVEVAGKQSWCFAAARHNGLLLGQKLFDEYGLHTDVEISFHDGCYVLTFTPVKEETS